MTITLDGAAAGTGSGGSAASATLTTSLANDIIVAVITTEDPANPAPTNSVASVTASGLTFTKRSSRVISDWLLPFGVHRSWMVEVWWAPAASALSSKIITATLAATSDATVLQVFGVNGVYDAVNPWDSDASLPGYTVNNDLSSHPTQPVFSTAAADTLVFAIDSGVTGPPNPTSSWTTIDVTGRAGGSSCQTGVFYHVYTSAQTSQSAPLTRTSNAAIFGVDALKAPGGGGGAGGASNFLLLF